MAKIDDLLEKIENSELQNALKGEVKKLKMKKKFGLVFEEHLPECTPLYDVNVTVGKNVSLRNGAADDIYMVVASEGEKVFCKKEGQEDTYEFNIDDVVVTAKFGETIYPYLKPIDSVCNAPDSELWHTLIEADNYHALQLLDYMYHGKVDCIYIDPPYNSGARDWKYNNNYVDENDIYRHSKWLSFMKKRLELAKKLLNPRSSVLIVTIDEKEHLHLGCLLEECFPEAKIQMVSSVINPKGSARDGFSRSDEYIFFVMFGECSPSRLPLSNEWSPSALVSAQDKANIDVVEKGIEPGWTSMMRRGTDSMRTDSPNLYYPIYVDPDTKIIKKIGNSLPFEKDRAEDIPGLIQVLPLRRNGTQGRWQVGNVELKKRIQQGRVRLGRPTTYGFVINYLPDGEYSKVVNGEYEIKGYAADGSMIAYKKESNADELRMPPTQWKIASHNASEKGTTLLNAVIGEKRFPFPKSLYAVHDTLRFFVSEKSDALIIDFFAGSGTTLHAVNLLNAEDKGNRRCIMITNNEVSDEEASELTKQGYKQGDDKWEELGIARYVTWPRTKCSIKGIDVNGASLNGEYITSNRKKVECNRLIKQIAINANLLDKNGRKSIIALLGKDNMPQSLFKNDSHYIISEKYSTSILFDLGYLDEYLESLSKNRHITDIYIVTESNTVFKRIKNEIIDLIGKYEKESTVSYPMADGFKANCTYFKLGFLDKSEVKIGRQFKELLPVLWMKTGAVGTCPTIESESLPDMLILPKNHFAVLIDDTCFKVFKEKVEQYPEIEHVYIVTNYQQGYRSKIAELNVANTYQLYSDYLDNFQINYRR